MDAYNKDATEYLWSNGSTDSIIEVSSDGLYRVTVSNPCSRVETSISVSFVEDSRITFDLGNDTLLCVGQQIILSPELPDAEYNYTWNDGSTSSSKQITMPGEYTLEVSNACGNNYSSSIRVDYLNLDLNLPNDTIFCADSAIVIDATNPKIESYLWSTGESTSSIEISQEGFYSIQIINQCDTFLREIFIEETDCHDCSIYIPNVFAQNSGGANDKCKIDASCQLMSFHLQVYSRWGNLIFESMDPSKTWAGFNTDGSTSGLGVYVYQLEFSYLKDSEIVADFKFGDVLLIK